MASNDLPRNAVKEKLARNEVVLSMTVRLTRTVEIAGIAKTAGFDSLYIDLEHSPLTIDATAQICFTSLALGIAPFVRVPSFSPEYISRVLDGGAMGIIAPHVQTPEEAEEIVRAVKFPPLGTRSIVGNLPHFGFRSVPGSEVAEELNRSTMVIIMVESGEALARVDELAAVDGVDMIFVGSNDLSGSLGIPGQPRHPEMRRAYESCMSACTKHGKHLGIGGVSAYPDIIAELIQLGARYISTGTDLSFLLNAATAKAKEFRQL